LLPLLDLAFDLALDFDVPALDLALGLELRFLAGFSA
jgi:hypothetical protein